MFTNFWKMATRSLLKRKGFTLINILGLSTGMGVCLLIVIFIRHELGFDKFEANGDRIYRVALDRIYPGRTTSYAIIPASLGGVIRKECPEVEASTGLVDVGGNGTFLLRVGDKSFEEGGVLAADSDFFRVFPMRLLAGDAATALSKPNMVVIDETTAIKVYGSAERAMGQNFESEGQLRFQVAGVCKDWPEHSHLRFHVLISVTTFPFGRDINYLGFSTYTYLLLKKNASPATLEAKLPQVVDKYAGGAIARGLGMTYRQFLAAGNGYHYYLQPLRQIHLTSDLEAEMRPNGSKRAITIFAIIAAFILGIAGVNFINLSTARSVERAKEVGIRKTFGSERRSLILQFLLESILVSVLSVALAVGLVTLGLPLFNDLAGTDLDAAGFLTIRALLALVALGGLVGLAAGLYPAFILSSFKPVVVLKGRFQANKYGVALRNVLVVGQFAISILLIICTTIVNRQMNYMLGNSLGFRKDHVVEIRRSDLVGSKTSAFRNELANLAGVEDVSGASGMPGDNGFFGSSWQQLDSRDWMTGRGIIVDDRFAATMGLTIREGRWFSKAFARDSLAIVLNEKAVEALGLKEPVAGTRLRTNTDGFNVRPDSPYTFTVVGVVNDFHFQTVHQAVAPLILANAAKFGDSTNVTAVRVKGEDLAGAIRGMEEVWRKFVPDRPFKYAFLDQSLAAQYKAEATLQKIFTVFSALAIFIACIGLLGLAAYTTQQRIREISIRKVLGAKPASIVRLLSKDFVRLVTLSALVAFPLAWLAMHAWLQGFVYRVGLSWWVFVAAWLASLAITLATISALAIRAAVINPIRILRSE
jgi:putative ABC transport system permease protein